MYMKGKAQEQKGVAKKPDTDLDDVKKILKKKALQTRVLKKIIGQNKPLENQS
jgi:hypothetical protein